MPPEQRGHRQFRRRTTEAYRFAARLVSEAEWERDRCRLPWSPDTSAYALRGMGTTSVSPLRAISAE